MNPLQNLLGAAALSLLGGLAKYSRRASIAPKLAAGVALAVAGLLATSPDARAQAVFVPTGSMHDARVNHTQTLLADGKVLVAGGYDGGTVLSSAELYDPSTGAWTATGSLQSPHYQHAAALLANGKVLVLGGQTGGAFADAELYDPTTGTWSVAASMVTPRIFPVCALLNDGRVLVTGGRYQGATAASEIFDPVANSWANTTTPLNAARYQHTMTVLGDGTVLAASGADESGYVQSSEIFDPSTSTWTTTTGAPKSIRTGHTANLLGNGQVLVTGGYDGGSNLTSAELYQPTTQTWSFTGSLHVARVYHTATVLQDGTVLAAGGMIGNAAEDNAELYDASTAAWTQVAKKLKTARYEHTATLLNNGAVLLAGGYDNSGNVLASSALYETPQPPVTTVGASQGGTVPGSSPTATYAGFGAPQPGPFLGTEQVGKVKTSVIFAPDGSVLLAPGTIVGAFIVSKVGPPNGDAAVVTLTAIGGIVAKKNAALVTGLLSGTPAISARTGASQPGLASGVTLNSLLAIDGNGTDTVFLAKLQGTGIKGSNNLALFTTLPNGTLNPLAVKGIPVTVNGTTSNVATIGTLVGVKGTLAAGRWRAGDTAYGVRLTLANKTQVVAIIPASATSPADWTVLAATGVNNTVFSLGDAVIKSFGLPGFHPGGAAYLETLASGATTAITPKNNQAIVSGTHLIARTGDGVVDATGGTFIPGLTYAKLTDPLSRTGGAIVYQATLAGTGVTAKNNAALCYAENGVASRLLARTGPGADGAAPGGGHFASFTSLVLPDADGRGPIFLATLAVSPADEITAKNNLGLWALDSLGDIVLLLRTQQTANGKTVKSFAALVPSPGSIGAANGYDATGKVAVLATFTDGTQALLKISVP